MFKMKLMTRFAICNALKGCSVIVLSTLVTTIGRHTDEIILINIAFSVLLMIIYIVP